MPGVPVLEAGYKAQVDRLLELLCPIRGCDAEAYGKDLIRIHGADVVFIRREADSRGRWNYGYRIQSIVPGVGHIQADARLGGDVRLGQAGGSRINLDRYLAVYVDYIVSAPDSETKQIGSAAGVLQSLDFVIDGDLIVWPDHSQIMMIGGSDLDLIRPG